jgi:putative DNA primase/helicase
VKFNVGRTRRPVSRLKGASPVSAAFDDWVAKARTIKIEDEIARRGVKLNGGIDRCGSCPKCGGDDRFSINVKKQVFHCRGCDTGGDVIALVEHLDDCDFISACTKLTGEPPPKPNGGNRGAAPKKITTAIFEYCDESGAIVYAIERTEYQNVDGTFVLKDGKRKKTFRQRRPDPEHPGEWLWNVDGVGKILYRLSEVIEAVAAGHLVFVVEGEGKVDALRELGIAATTNPGGAGKWQHEFGEHLRGADVILLPDNDEPGWKHVHEVGAALVGIAGRTRVLVLPDLPAKGDIRNWLAAGGTREQLDVLVEAAPNWQLPEEAPSDKERDKAKAKAATDELKLIDELAKASRLDYEKRRRDEARRMGIRSSALDDEVAARRAERAEEEGPPPLFGHWVVEPWPEAVDTSELLLAIVGRIKRHVILSDDEALTVALWILFSWVHAAAAVHSPLLLVTSAERDSGKSQLMNLIGFLVCRALSTVGIGEAALFRSIERYQPTVFVDEADTLLVDNEPLRAVLNSGWTRGSCVLRCVGDDHVPHAFPTFCPKAIGMKGRKLPDTTLSRAIIVEMKRKKATEKVNTHFRSIDDAGLAELRRRALRWADDSGEKLQDAEPNMPPGFDNRLGDNWHLLLAIADYAGGEWPGKARKAAAKLSKVADIASTNALMLADIKAVFDGPEKGIEPFERVSSAELAETLGNMKDRPWAEWKSGKPITQVQLARVLKDFGIYPENIKLSSGAVVRGYLRSQFEDAWERYL